jgi:hypothetical protein
MTRCVYQRWPYFSWTTVELVILILVLNGGIVEKRVEKLNVLMLIHDERHIVLYVFSYIFSIFENPHLIPNLPLVAHITVTLRPCKTCVFCYLWNYPLIFTRFKYLEIIGKCVILSIAFAKPGTIFPS